MEIADNNIAGPKKKVLFYTRPCYLDAALEFVKIAQVYFELHVVIQMSKSELVSNIFNLSVDLSQFNVLSSFREVSSIWDIDYLKPYFESCDSVNFLIYKDDGLVNALTTSRKLISFTERLKPDFLHFDDFTGKQLFLLPLFFKWRSKLILNVHDPKPHTGEFSKLTYYIQEIMYNLPEKLIVFSEFSRTLLDKRLKNTRQITTLRLLPYSIFKHFETDIIATDNREFISFVGRLSPYKGIEIFIDAIKEVVTRFPNQKFLIAGKTLFGYQLNYEVLELLADNISVREKYLTNEEIVSIIKNSKLIVCPYLDATQSGVIMTALALNRPVLVTDIGGLAEYIVPGSNGLISHELTSKGLAEQICFFIENQLDKKIDSSDTINSTFKTDVQYNSKVLAEIYK